MKDWDPGDHASGAASGLAFGSFLLMVGLALAIGGACIQPSGMTNQRDIGPRVAPIALGVILMLGGVAISSERWWSSNRASSQEPSEVDSKVRPWIVLLGMIACTAMMPVAGFMAPAALLSVGILLLLGARWWEAFAASVVILGMVRLLFVETFQVVLPTGPWGF